MDGESASIFQLNTCDRRSNDRISELPDEIIVDILSLLPLREAARASIVSSRWSHLRKHIPNLDFNARTLGNEARQWNADKCKYVEMANSVLRSHKARFLKKFRISFYVNKSGKSAVDKWLEFVFSRQVERLELDFKCWEDEYKVVLGLEELMRESRIRLQPQTDLILFNSLRSLCLKYLVVSGQDIKLFLRSCPLLEQLIIGDTVLTSDVELCGANLVLKHFGMYCCSGNKSVKVSAPNLTWMEVDDTAGKLLLENVPRLVRANIRIRSETPHAAKSFGSDVFSCISSQLKSLYLTLHCPMMEFLANGVYKMPNLKKLVFRYYGGTAYSFMPITALIWASPHLEEFKIEVCSLMQFGTMYKNLFASGEVESEVERPRHQNLKVFELAGFPVDHVHLVDELVTHIFTSCVALEKIIFGRNPWVQYNVKLDDSYHALGYLKRQLRPKLPPHIQLQLA